MNLSSLSGNNNYFNDFDCPLNTLRTLKKELKFRLHIGRRFFCDPPLITISINFFSFFFSRIRKAFKCHCGKSYKTSQKLKNHTLLVHSAGSTSDLSLSSSSMSSLNSTQQLSDSASPPLAITSLKNSINLVTIKSSKANGKNESSKIPKLTPMKGYDGLGILTPATSPKNQAQQQQQQQSTEMLNGSLLNGSAENLLTPVSPAPSPSSSTTSTTSYQQIKKGES